MPYAKTFKSLISKRYSIKGTALRIEQQVQNNVDVGAGIIYIMELAY
jgi:hypothetical protein